METYKIAKLFSTPERVRIMQLVLDNPEKKFGVRELARAGGTSPAQVSKYLKVLRSEGLVKEGVMLNNPKTRSIKVLLNVTKIEHVVNRIRQIKGVKGFGIYGSWANGTNYASSDLDIWIFFKEHPKEIEIAGLQNFITKKMETETSILVLTDKKLKELREQDPVFYFSLVNSLVIWGERID